MNALNVYISYSKKDYDRALSIVKSINGSLGVKCELILHEYSDLDNYVEEFIAPAIESSKVFLFLLSKNSKEDTLVNEEFRIASNLNKTVVPVIISSDKIGILQLQASSGFSLRSKSKVFEDESDRIALVEQLHSLLGLTSIGDTIGTWVNLSVDENVSVSRNKIELGNVNPPKPFRLKLKKGLHRLRFSSFNGEWQEYEINVPYNEGTELSFSVEMSTLDRIKKNRGYSSNSNGFDSTIDLASNREGWSLSSSSIDLLKRASIINYYVIKYQGAVQNLPQRQAYLGIELPSWLDGIVSLVSN